MGLLSVSFKTQNYKKYSKLLEFELKNEQDNKLNCMEHFSYNRF